MRAPEREEKGSVDQNGLRLRVVFYRTEQGHEPVREWLKSLSGNDKKTIGEDIKTVQYGWPLGMPLLRKLDDGLWEIRSRLDNRIARVVVSIAGDVMVLIHGFIKKTEKTPKEDLWLAKKRLANLQG